MSELNYMSYKVYNQLLSTLQNCSVTNFWAAAYQLRSASLTLPDCTGFLPCCVKGIQSLPVKTKTCDRAEPAGPNQTMLNFSKFATTCKNNL